jgi:hypothetical protein
MSSRFIGLESIFDMQQCPPNGPVFYRIRAEPSNLGAPSKQHGNSMDRAGRASGDPPPPTAHPSARPHGQQLLWRSPHRIPHVTGSLLPRPQLQPPLRARRNPTWQHLLLAPTSRSSTSASPKMSSSTM